MRKSYKDYLPENVSWFRLPEYLDNIRSFVTFSDLLVGDGLISGGVAWTGTDLIFESSEIVYTIGNIKYTAPGVNPIELEPTSPGLDRIDVFAVNTQGEIVVIMGEESADPIKPDVIEGEQVEVTFAVIRDGQIVPEGVTNIKVYDENLQVLGGEWDTSTGSPGTITLASNIDAQSGSVTVRFDNAVNNDFVVFTNDSLIDGTTIDKLVFRVKLTNTIRQGHRLIVRALSTVGVDADPVVINDGQFGFNARLENTWQTIIIPTNSLGVNGTTFDVITIGNTRRNASFLVDNVELQTGLSTVILIPEYTLGIAGTDLNLEKDGDVVSTVDLSSIATSPTGLEAIDEGNGIGWRLIGRNPANYGNIGLDSTDLSFSSGASSTRGATGDYSLVAGYENIDSATGGENFIMGYQNTITGISYDNIVGGSLNTVTANYSSLVVGTENTALGGTNGIGGHLLLGRQNYLNGYFMSALSGAGLRGTGSYTTIAGISNVDFSENQIGTSNTQRRLFVVGNGTVDGLGARLTSSDAFQVFYEGQVIAPSFSIAEIDAEATGKALVTREWVETEITANESPFQALNEGSGIGYIIRGSNRAQAGNVGFGAFDFGYYFTNAAQGATGTYSFNLAGEDNVLSGYNAIGSGYGNQAINNYNIALGTWNVASDFGSVAIGVGLISKSDYSVVVGKPNVDYTHYTPFNDGRKPVFIVGIGNVAAGSPPNVSTRNDGLCILSNGKFGININDFPNDTNSGASSSILQLNGTARFLSYGGGTVTGTPTFSLAVSATGEIIETALASTPSLQAVTDVGNTTTLNIDALSFNALPLFYAVGTTEIGIGTQALENNTGADVIGLGFRAGQNNVLTQCTLIGTYAGQNNTGTGVFVGQSAGVNNDGTNVVGVGNSTLQNSIGDNATAIGHNTGGYNKGINFTGIGTAAGRFNTKDAVITFGVNSSLYNQGDNNTVLGTFAFTDFKDDVANLKNVAVAATDVDTVLNRITITAHGFGATNDYVNLRYTTTGTNIGGLSNTSIYQFLIVDGNTIEAQVNLSSTGTDIHTFTPQFVYSNVTVLGANAEPTKSNQVTLGDAAVTEVVSGNYIFNVGQTLGVGQDDYVLTYDNGTGQISLEAAAAGGGGAFEIIDEGNGNGIIRAGRTAANYGNVGLDAADLSINTAVSTTVGATGTRATAIGFQSTASGINAIAMGQLSVADGNDSFTMGVQANASGLYSVAIGRLAIASAQSAVAIGYNTSNASQQSVAIGSSNVMLAPATGSTSVGASNTTRQTGQHIFGNGNDSGTGGSNIIFGANNNISSNTIGMAIGRNNTTDGNEAITIGRNLTTHSYREVAYGVANTTYTAGSEIAWDANDRLVVIGAGQPGTSTKDAFTVLKGGAIGINIDNFEASVQSDVDVEVGGTFVAHKAVKNDTTTTYAFVLTDKDKVVTFDNAGAVAATIPANASVAYPIGTQITLINKGAGTVTVGITTDTLNQNVGALTLAQYDKRTLTKIAATEWILGY